MYSRTSSSSKGNMNKRGKKTMAQASNIYPSDSGLLGLSVATLAGMLEDPFVVSKKNRPTSAKTKEMAVVAKRDEDETVENSTLSESVAPKKSVRFDSVEIREYATILGCNPGGIKGGPPLTIDWEPLNAKILALEEYESTRGPRRKVAFLRLSKEEREQLLVDLGFNPLEIQLADQLCEAIRSSRGASAQDDPELQERRRKSKEKAQELRREFLRVLKEHQKRKGKREKVKKKRNGLLWGLYQR